MVKVDDYEIAEGLYYSKDWMWIKVEDGKARIGITDYAQKQLREIVFTELPNKGGEVIKGEPFGTVESVKSVSDLVAPLTGKIEDVNAKAVDSPETINEDPYGKGWLILVSPTDLETELGTLMDFPKSVEWHRELAKEK